MPLLLLLLLQVLPFASFYSERYRAEVVPPPRSSSSTLFILPSDIRVRDRLRSSQTAAPGMMLRAATLLLGLVLSLRAEFAPPTLNISLDDDPEVRWEALSKVFNVEYIKKAAAEIIE